MIASSSAGSYSAVSSAPRDVGREVYRIGLKCARAHRHVAQPFVELRDAGERRAGVAERPRRTAVVGGERLTRGVQRRGDAFDVVEKRAAFVEAFFLVGLETRIVDFARGEERVVVALAAAALVGRQARQRVGARPRQLVRSRDRAARAQRRVAGKPVEQLEMIARREKLLCFVLADDLDDGVAQFAQRNRPSKGAR